VQRRRGLRLPLGHLRRDLQLAVQRGRGLHLPLSDSRGLRLALPGSGGCLSGTCGAACVTRSGTRARTNCT